MLEVIGGTMALLGFAGLVWFVSAAANAWERLTPTSERRPEARSVRIMGRDIPWDWDRDHSH